MTNRSITAVILLGLASIAQAGIDLTPTVSEYVAEGIKFQQLTFSYGKQQIEYEPPRGWSFDGTANQLRLQPPKKPFAEALISVAAATKPRPFDPTTNKLLEQEVTAGLPAGSQFVNIEQELENPILLSGNRSFEITVSFQLMGEKLSRSALFVNLPDTQLVFRLTARKQDFGTLHREFQSSLLSWHYAEPAQAAEQADKVPTAASTP